MASPVNATLAQAEVGEISVAVDATLSPPYAQGQGFWIGRPTGNDATRLAGWGPLIQRLVCQRESTIDITGLEARPEPLLLLPAASAIASRLASLPPLRSAAVLGKGPLAAFTESWLRQQQVSIVPLGVAKSAELLIDTDGEPTRWEQALPTVRDEGTVVLFVPPWAPAVDFDFYQVIHRRSLRLVAGRWHRISRQPSVAEFATLLPLVASVMADGRYLTGTTAGPSAPDGDNWLLTTHLETVSKP